MWTNKLRSQGLVLVPTNFTVEITPRTRTRTRRWTHRARRPRRERDYLRALDYQARRSLQNLPRVTKEEFQRLAKGEPRSERTTGQETDSHQATDLHQAKDPLQATGPHQTTVMHQATETHEATDPQLATVTHQESDLRQETVTPQASVTRQATDSQQAAETHEDGDGAAPGDGNAQGDEGRSFALLPDGKGGQSRLDLDMLTEMLLDSLAGELIEEAEDKVAAPPFSCGLVLAVLGLSALVYSYSGALASLAVFLAGFGFLDPKTAALLTKSEMPVEEVIVGLGLGGYASLYWGPIYGLVTSAIVMTTGFGEFVVSLSRVSKAYLVEAQFHKSYTQ